MKQDKKIPKPPPEPSFREEWDGEEVLGKYEAPTPIPKVQAVGPKMYVAAHGHALPIFYKGSIIYISETPVEIDLRALSYEAQHQFQTALDRKQIMETGV